MKTRVLIHHTALIIAHLECDEDGRGELSAGEPLSTMSQTGGRVDCISLQFLDHRLIGNNLCGQHVGREGSRKAR